MSHNVTITRTTTTTTTSAILLNTGYVKSLPGILKVVQLLIGSVVVGLLAHSLPHYRNIYSTHDELFFLIVASACVIATGCLLISCLLSISTASIIAKTIFELIYHGVAFILMLIASIIAMVQTTRQNYRTNTYETQLIAALLMLMVLLTVLYATSSLATLVTVVRRNAGFEILETGYTGRINCCILGLINAGLYLLSTILAYKSYRGG